MMFKQLTAALGLLLLATPALADPKLSPDAARKLISRYQKERREIVYFEKSADGLGDMLLNEIAYCSAGMQLAGNFDFLKDHPIMILRKSLKRAGTKVRVTDEVIAPVWSKKNGAHVLRPAMVTYETFIIPSPASPVGIYEGIDGLTHRI